MSRENSVSFLILILALLFLFIFDSASSSCPTKCGGVEIPYPFGIGEHCYLNKWYEIQCRGNDSVTFLPALGKEVVHISLPSNNYHGVLGSYGSIRIKNPITSKGCSTKDEKEEAAESLLNLTGSPFYVSYSNTLVAVGCNITTSLTTLEQSTVGCSSSCGSSHPSPTPPQNYLEFISCKIKQNTENWLSRRRCDARSIQNETICNGVGCCQASIPDGLQQVGGVRIDENTATPERGCKVAFLTDEAYSLKHRSDPQRFYAKRFSTVDLGWFIHTTNVSFIHSLGCRNIIDDYLSTEENCGCEYSADSSYATCVCNGGYRGNPYLPGGCRDIDECLENSTDGKFSCLRELGSNTCLRLPRKSPCAYRGWGTFGVLKHTCVNNPGTHTYRSLVPPYVGFGIVLALGFLIFVGGIYLIYKCIKIRRRMNRKKKFFKRNGGLLLQQQLISTEGHVEKTKIFSSKELKKATENFSSNRVLGQGGQGTVYKGMLVDGGIVAVKKSKLVDEDKIEEFINEVFILSQINHRNIVKLLGCCLETEVPILVYEFISNGNLFEHLHDDFDDDTMITWEFRLRIAEDIAGALSYLHSAASLPVYHRDIKSTNIMLDEKYRAKVSDFGTSRSITIDHTHLTTVVSGTIGYVDPEYFQSSQFTDKSDVYSFGVVLVELITGAKPISFLRSQENRTLATYFIHAIKENRLDEIIDARIKEESKLAQIMSVAKLARRCLNLKGRKRPSMREVSMELERICSLQGGDSEQLVDIIESDEEEETMEVNIEVVEPWNNVSLTENIETSFVDAEPLFPRQTW